MLGGGGEGRGLQAGRSSGRLQDGARSLVISDFCYFDFLLLDERKFREKKKENCFKKCIVRH